MYRRRFVPLLLLLPLILAAGAKADVKLFVDVGWSDKFKTGRWTPLYVTVSDSQPRNVILEVYSPHDNNNAMRIRQHVGIGPAPSTYLLLAPLSWNSDGATVSVRDTDERELSS